MVTANIISNKGVITHQNSTIDLNSYVVGSGLYHDGGELRVRWDPSETIIVVVNARVAVIIDVDSGLRPIIELVSQLQGQNQSEAVVKFNQQPIDPNNTVAILRDNTAPGSNVEIDIEWNGTSTESLKINLIIPPILTRSYENIITPISVNPNSTITSLVDYVMAEYHVNSSEYHKNRRVLLYFKGTILTRDNTLLIKDYAIQDDDSINIGIISERYSDQLLLKFKLNLEGNYNNVDVMLPIDMDRPLSDVTKNLSGDYGVARKIKLLLNGAVLDGNRYPSDYGIDQNSVISVVPK